MKIFSFIMLIFLFDMMAVSPIEKILETYKPFLEKGTYDGQDWSSFHDHVPASRYVTFKKAFLHFENYHGKVVVELGTSRSFVHGGLIGCNQDDMKFWQPNNPETWDWGAGFFTRMAAESLAHLQPVIHTVDIVAAHIRRCQIMTKQFKNFITYHVASSLTFLENDCTPGSIDLLYMDTGDMTPLEPTALLQLAEAEIIVKRNLIAPHGIILIDDVKNQTPKQFGEMSNLGKSKYSLPYLLEHGFKIIANEYQIILEKI